MEGFKPVWVIEVKFGPTEEFLQSSIISPALPSSHSAASPTGLAWLSIGHEPSPWPVIERPTILSFKLGIFSCNFLKDSKTLDHVSSKFCSALLPGR